MPICQKCNNSFPKFLRIDGKQKSLVSRKFCLVCSPYKLHNTISLQRGKQYFHNLLEMPQKKFCKRCNQELPIEAFGIHQRTGSRTGQFYLFPYCKSCDSNRKCSNKKRLKEDAIKYKGGKCQKCGYSKCITCLDFHHRDPAQKDFNISQYYGVSLEDIKVELDKCDLLCKLCHCEEHEKLKRSIGVVVTRLLAK